jgi:hypothetical protein
MEFAMPQDLDANLATARDNPQFFVCGHNLSDAERAVIRPRDTWEIALINSIATADQEAVQRCLAPLHLLHYNGIQVREWFGTQKFLLGQLSGGAVEESILMLDAEKHRNLVRYRLCYTLNFPYKVALSTAPYAQARDAVDAFLAMAELLHPFGYPYYTVLWTNSLLHQKGQP